MNDKRIAIGTLSSGLVTRARGDGSEDLDRWIRIQQYENDPLAKYDDDVREFMENRQKLRYMSNEAQAMGKEKYIRYVLWSEWVDLQFEADTLALISLAT